METTSSSHSGKIRSQVSGAVYNANSFRYEPTEAVAGYLNDAGGPTRPADTRRIFIIRADGTLVSRQSHGQFWRTDFESLALQPGDSVIVPPRIKCAGGSCNNFSPRCFLRRL